MAVVLTLGGVAFADFEVPATINFGGTHALAIHRMPGGNRIIDAMGPDDADIHWSGRFRGTTAEERALLLDFMRRSGQQALLTWSLQRFQVVIREFTANFQQSYEIPYSITCSVVLNETMALANIAVGAVEALASDLAAAAGLADIIDNATISTAVTGVTTALTNYQASVPNATNVIAGTAAVAEAPLISALQASITGAQTATHSAITTASGTTTGSGPAAGGSPSVMAAALSDSASGFGQLGTLYQLSHVLGRMAVNAANVGN